MRSRSMRAAAPSCQASWTRTRTLCSPATGATSCGAALPARRTPTSRPPAAASSAAFTRPARRPTISSWPTRAGASTTRCEAKSGYALTVDGELKMLRALRRLAASHDIEIAPTFMGAHDVPLEYRERRREYVDLVVREMIPAVARERLAEWCDAFC